MKQFSLLLLAALCLALSSCKDDEDDPVTHTFSYDFQEGPEGWMGDFSDYPAGWDPERFGFRFEHAPLPAAVGVNAHGMLISGRNYSDDLFMYMKRQVSGLRPEHEYLLRAQVTLASQYPTESFGIGGSPGSSVYLKAGASTYEPLPVEEEDEIRMNIDKGNQSQSGSDMIVIGHVGIPGEEFEYQLIQRHNREQPVRVRSDASGSLWLIIGTDSGFEGESTLYYHQVEISLEE